MKRSLLGLVTVAACVMVFETAAFAQRAGDVATIRHGIVIGHEKVDLNDGNAMKGALVGGAIGVAATSSNKDSSRRKRNAALGALIGAGVAASKKKSGRRYSVQTNDGTIIQIATEQTEIHINDCVVIEESGGRANIRRTAQSACDAASQSVMNSPDVQAGLQEEAAECTAAKQGLVVAETDEQIDFAVRKIQILCYN